MTKRPPEGNDTLLAYLAALHLHFIREHYQALANEAAAQQWPHLDYLARLIEGEAQRREQRAIERRIKEARFPVRKTLDEFQWSWPKKINRLQVQNLFRLAFVDTHTNIVFLGNVGLGKTHLCIALGLTACVRGHSVLFTTAVDIINTLAAAQSTGALKREMNRYLKPKILLIDELGYLPIDKRGADLLFQIISQRYERGPIVITTNRAYKTWPEIFNNDSTLTSALLDRLLHHAETVLMEGKSFRTNEQNES
jgi:DNA replication protein DnaC